MRERSEGAAWRLPKRPGRSGKQEVAGAASALATEQLRGEGEEDDRGRSGGGLGRWRSWAGWLPGERQVRFLSSVFYFCFVLFYFI